MRDIQNETTPFPPRIIQSVGANGICAMLSVHRAHLPPLSLLARFSAACPLAATVRGLNMSRMARTIYAYLDGAAKEGVSNLEELACALMMAHKSVGAEVCAAFDYPIETASPVSGIKGTKTVKVLMYSKVSIDGGRQNSIKVSTTEMSLCPCSKEMSLLNNDLTAEEEDAIRALPVSLQEKLKCMGRGAHNQSVDITAEIDLPPQKDTNDECTAPEIESIYAILSSCASAITYPVLKREDEKYTTEHAWAAPRFVEDIARSAASKIESIHGIAHFRLEVESRESIHSDGITAAARMSV